MKKDRDRERREEKESLRENRETDTWNGPSDLE